MLHNALNSSTVTPACRMSFLSRPGLNRRVLLKDIIIIYLIMMSNKTEFSMIGIKKLKNDPVRNIYPEAPSLMPLWVEFLDSQRRVKRITLEKLCLFYSLFLDIFRKRFKEFIEGCSCGDLHLFSRFSFDNLRERISFCSASFFMILLREIKEFKKLLFVKACSVTECIKGLFTYLQVDTFRSCFCDDCFKFWFHKSYTSINGEIL